MSELKPTNGSSTFRRLLRSSSKNNLYYVLIFVFVFIISFGDLLNFLPRFNPFPKYYAIPLFLATAAFIFLPAYLLRSRPKLYFIFLIPAFLVLPIRLGAFFLFNVLFSDQIVILMLNTNPMELSELASNYSIEMAIGAIIYIGIIYYLYKKIPGKFPPNTSQKLSIASLVVLFALPILYPYDTSKSYLSNCKKELVSAYPGNILVICRDVFHQFEVLYTTKSIRDKFHFFPKQDAAVSRKQIHVLIIGESCRYDHWGINGYGRETSPKLSKRKNLISFNNVAAGSFATDLAVPLLLTGVGAGNYDLHVMRKSVVGLFDELGFSTYWLSNQSDMGHITIHTREAKHTFFYFSKEIDNRAEKGINNMDMTLISKLRNAIKDSGDKKFIVLHSTGSHYSYSSRYPDSYDIFKPSNKSITTTPTERKYRNILVNSYDNSILYTDAFVDSVMGIIDSQNVFSSVCYMADHGEDLADDDRNLCFHAYPIPSKYVAHIPFFVWYSPELEEKFPGNISNLMHNKDAKISSENLIHTITGLLGIHYPSQDSQKNIAGNNFKENEQIFLGTNSILYHFSDLK
jgi:glucan phosphoethanolaminetransferase (alkaline phosphatase superfamily)